MTTDVEKIANGFMMAWDSRDMDKVLDFFTDDFYLENLATGEVIRGKKELDADHKNLLATFPDFKWELKSCLSAGDRAAIEWVISGTQSGELAGMPATGKRFSLRGVSIMELRDGKYCRETAYSNFASLLQQLGLMPALPK